MADVFTRSKRSEVMSCILSRSNASTELRLRTALRMHGIKGWRRHLPIPGRPDFAFPKAKVALFVDGCFWHGCSLHFRMPAANRAFWRTKIRRNVARDRATSGQLRKRGWQALRIWEHALKTPAGITRTVGRIIKALKRGTSKSGRTST